MRASSCERYPALPKDLLQRFATHVRNPDGAIARGSTGRTADLGGHFGAGLYAREVDYLVANEWARTADDILFRRTKLGLHVPPDAADRLNAYIGKASRAGRREAVALAVRIDGY